MQTALIIVAVVVLILLVWVVMTYNRLTRFRQHTRESWADIDVQMKRRYDLIPNLVEITKGYAKHERELLERVVALRNQAAANDGPESSQAADESSLMLELKRVFAVVEAYPDLKADQHFRSLQKELSLTEDRIAAARRFFNGNVREMTTLCQMFPSKLVASMFGFPPRDYFELEDAAERVVPRVAM